MPVNGQRALHGAHLVMGLVIWSLWFVALYGSLSVVCSLAPPAIEAGPLNWLNAGLLVITLLTTGLLGVAAWRCWQLSPDKQANNFPLGRFMGRLAAAIYLLSAVSTLAVGLPVLVLPPCI
ncbi:MAG: hypothetical protein EA349_01170 [Halomonadaceae bacterium]|nr:MAG: hypothetical protein EA349_01170 [Halomonadaceae bacterium]